jgi:hypothetical protein
MRKKWRRQTVPSTRRARSPRAVTDACRRHHPLPGGAQTQFQRQLFRTDGGATMSTTRLLYARFSWRSCGTGLSFSAGADVGSPPHRTLSTQNIALTSCARRRLASPPLWSCDYGAANYPLDDPASPPDPNANRPRDGTSDAPWLDLPENAVPRCETTRPAAVPTPSAGAWIVFFNLSQG